MAEAIVLLTDFGVADAYVGVMKGVLLGIAGAVPIVDLSHAVPPQDVRRAALLLDAAWPYFAPGSVFLCVVDPGVGTSRRPVVARAADRLFVGPDNGLFSLLPDPEVRELTSEWGLPTRSATFHGRDLFAPAAAQLMAGARFEDVGPLVLDPVVLEFPAAAGGLGEVIDIDHFGNCITNLPGAGSGFVDAAGVRAPVVRTYGEAAAGDVVALTGSTGRLEVAVVNGSAADRLGLYRGSAVRWSPT